MNLSKRIDLAIDALSGTRARMHDYGKEDTVQLLKDIKRAMYQTNEAPTRLKKTMTYTKDAISICILMLVYMGIFRILHEYMELPGMLSAIVVGSIFVVYMYGTYILRSNETN